MASTKADFRTAGARVAPMAEITRRRAMPIDDFIRAHPNFRWSWRRWSSVLVDSAGRVWQPMLSEDGIPYDLESTPEEDEDDIRAALDAERREGGGIPFEQLEREFAAEDRLD